VFLLVYKAGEDLRLLELDNEVIEVMEISPEEDSKNKGRHRHMNEGIFKEKFAKWERQKLKEVQRIQAVPSTFPATDTKKKDAVTRRGTKRDRKLEEGTDGKIETSVSTWLHSNLPLVLDVTLAPLLASYCQTTKGKPRKRAKTKGFSNQTVCPAPCYSSSLSFRPIP
jgi:hypothetical protein